MRRTTFTYEILAPDAGPGDPAFRVFVVEPGGSARAFRRTSRGRVQERSFALSSPGYESFMLAVVRAIHAEARPVRPDAIRPPGSPVARLTIERDALRMQIEGPVEALWRAELAGVSFAFWRAAIFRPDHNALDALLPEEAPEEEGADRWQVARAAAAPEGVRRAHVAGAFRESPVWRFSALPPGQRVAGPAIVESDTTTVLLSAGDVSRVDARGWLEVEVG